MLVPRTSYGAAGAAWQVDVVQPAKVMGRDTTSFRVIDSLTIVPRQCVPLQCYSVPAVPLHLLMLQQGQWPPTIQQLRILQLSDGVLQAVLHRDTHCRSRRLAALYTQSPTSPVSLVPR